MDISKLPVADETITEITGSITDTSVQKEALFTNMVKNRDRLQSKMYAQSGFSVEFELVEVSPGVKVQVMKKVAFKETPRFEQPLPTGPSVHPAWKTADNLVDKTMQGILWYTGLTQLGKVLENGQNKATPQYYGNYNPQTAEPYIVNPVIVP